MKIPVYTLPEWNEESLPILNNIITKIIHALNNIEFGNLTSNENIWCDLITVDGGDADEACSAAHELRRKPVGTIVIWQDKAAILYKPTDAASADTTTQFFYTFNTAATSAVLLLI